MSNFIFFIYFIFILNLISIIVCQFESESMTKAIACMAVLNQKLKGKEPQPNIYSSMMLKCFVTITNSQSKKILVDLEAGGTISQKEIKKLTDYNSLRNMSPKELEKKSNELEKAIKKFQKMQEDFNKEGGGNIDPADYDDDDENFNTETPKNIHFFGLIPKGIYGIFNVFNNYLSLFIVFLIVYFGLLMIRKINDSEKKMKKKKKIEEEYEEEEDECEPEIKEQSIKNQNNNKKNVKVKENKNENKNLNKKEKNG